VIYSFAREEAIITFASHPRNRAINKQSDINARLRESRCKIAVAEDESNSELATRQFGSLTQVCRTIREEYLPLYKAATTHCVSSSVLQKHLDTVLLRDCHHISAQSVPVPDRDCVDPKPYWEAMNTKLPESAVHITRYIVVDFSMCRTSEIERHPPLLLFLPLCTMAPRIRVRHRVHDCKGDSCRIHPTLGALFDSPISLKTSAWHNKGVQFMFCSLFELNIVLEMDSLEAWMSIWNNHRSHNIPWSESSQWAEEVGLPLDMQSHHAVFFLKRTWTICGICIIMGSVSAIQRNTERKKT
jgi:hypothetical protein